LSKSRIPEADAVQLWDHPLREHPDTPPGRLRRTARAADRVRRTGKGEKIGESRRRISRQRGIPYAMLEKAGMLIAPCLAVREERNGEKTATKAHFIHTTLACHSSDAISILIAVTSPPGPKSRRQKSDHLQSLIGMVVAVREAFVGILCWEGEVKGAVWVSCSAH